MVGPQPRSARSGTLCPYTTVFGAWGSWATVAAGDRRARRQARPERRRRREFYDWLLDGPVADALRKEQPSQAQQLLEDELREPQTAVSGKVILVGAGPGDPEIGRAHV